MKIYRLLLGTNRYLWVEGVVGVPHYHLYFVFWRFVGMDRSGEDFGACFSHLRSDSSVTQASTLSKGTLPPCALKTETKS